MTEKTNLACNKPLEIAACMFDLGNGKFAHTLEGGQKYRSLIIDVDEDKGRALGLCPVFIMLPWSFIPLTVGTFEIASGRLATAIVLEEAAKQGVQATAAEFCFNYEGFGVEKGTAFLPTRFELARIITHKSKFGELVNVTGLNIGDSTFWSSSICKDDATVWMLSMGSHSVSGYKQQSQTFGVLPMIEIVL